MGHYLKSFDTLSRIPVGNIPKYLVSHGWSEVDSDEAGSYWDKPGKDDPEQYVWLPRNPKVKTFLERVAQLLNSVARVEQRDFDDVVRDIVDLERDVQEVRTFPDGTPGSMSLPASAESVQGLRRWVESSAVAVALEDAGSVLPKRRPPQAAALVASTEMLTPVPGSFIWRISVPISDRPGQEPFPFPLASSRQSMEDYSRRTTMHMYSSIRAAAEAASEVIAGVGDLESFKRRIPEGVSADLCEALVQTSADGLTPLEFNFRWSVRRRPVVSMERPLLVSREQLETISWAGKQLRMEELETDVTITGFVVRLLRSGPSDTPGKITIAGRDAADPQSSILHYWVNLNADDYHRAGDAHSDYREVRVTGDLKRTPRRRFLLNPRALQVLGPVSTD